MQRFLEGDVPVIDAVFKHKSYLRGFSNSEGAGRLLDRNLPTVCSSHLEIHICCPRVWQRKKQWTSPFFSLKQCVLKSTSRALVVSNTVTAKANQSDPSQANTGAVLQPAHLGKGTEGTAKGATLKCWRCGQAAGFVLEICLERRE